MGKVSLTRNLGCGAVLRETGIKVCLKTISEWGKLFFYVKLLLLMK